LKEQLTLAELDRKKRQKSLILHIIGLVCFFAIWQIACVTELISSRSLASPTKVLETLIDKVTNSKPDGSTLLQHFWMSFRLSFTGFILAVVLGVPLGLVMGYYRIADKFITPIFEIVRPIPPIAWIPVVILTMGIGFNAKVFIIFISSFVGCVINSYVGIKLTNQTLINVAKTYGASDWQIFTKVCIPSSLNMVFAGVRSALNGSWGTLCAAEMLASTSGLGYMIQTGRKLIRPDIILVGMIVIGAVGAIMGAILNSLEEKVAPWRYR